MTRDQNKIITAVTPIIRRRQRAVIWIYGLLGTGKTTLAKFLCEHFELTVTTVDGSTSTARSLLRLLQGETGVLLDGCTTPHTTQFLLNPWLVGSFERQARTGMPGRVALPASPVIVISAETPGHRDIRLHSLGIHCYRSRLFRRLRAAVQWTPPPPPVHPNPDRYHRP